MSLTIYEIEYKYTGGIYQDLYDWLVDKGYINERGVLYILDKKRLIYEIKQDKEINDKDKYFWIKVISGLKEGVDYVIF